MQCPCGSKKTFNQCCYPIINKENTAASPEQLMRSRYSAYATKNARYIYETYAADSQKLQSLAEIQQWANSSTWVSLNVVNTSEGNTLNNELPYVEFIAQYLLENILYEMRENSRFVLEKNCWKYLDGDALSHKNLGRVKRNDLCPCQSGKKFKQCCAR